MRSMLQAFTDRLLKSFALPRRRHGFLPPFEMAFDSGEHPHPHPGEEGSVYGDNIVWQSELEYTREGDDRLVTTESMDMPTHMPSGMRNVVQVRAEFAERGLSEEVANRWFWDNEDDEFVSGSDLGEYFAELDAQGVEAAWQQLAAEAMQTMASYAERQADASQQMVDISQDQWDYYERVFQPREEAFVAEIFEGIPIQQMVETAGAEVRQAFSGQQQMAGRQLERFGIDPTSPRYAAILGDVDIARAAAEAGARTGARSEGRNLDFARRTSALQMGRGLPSESVSAAATGLQGMQGAGQTAASGYAFPMQTQGTLVGMGESQRNRNAAYNLAGIQAEGGAGGGYWGGLLNNAVSSFTSALGNRVCWVAREVYGEDNPRWLLFRHWLLGNAPAWFRKLYIRHGERFAEWLKGKDCLKAVIRYWMDSRIASFNKESINGVYSR